MANHRVRTNEWLDGKLNWKDIWFSSIEDAKDFVDDLVCDSWKIFDVDSIVIDFGFGKKHHHPAPDCGYTDHDPGHGSLPTNW